MEQDTYQRQLVWVVGAALWSPASGSFSAQWSANGL